MKTSVTERLLRALSSWECFGFVSKSGGLAREVSNIRGRMDPFFSELSGFARSRFTQVRGQISTLGVNRGAERASRLIAREIFFVLRFPVSAFATNHSSAEACKCSNGLTFKRHLK